MSVCETFPVSLIMSLARTFVKVFSTAQEMPHVEKASDPIRVIGYFCSCHFTLVPVCTSYLVGDYLAFRIKLCP